jgi:hypothetical protein
VIDEQAGNLPVEPPAKKSALEDIFGTAPCPAPVPQTLAQQVTAELLKYRAEPDAPITSCPLEWWRDNQQHYPLLSKLARIYLCVPATSVPSERLFSCAGDLVTAQRSLLSGENVDMLIFLKKNMKI